MYVTHCVAKINKTETICDFFCCLFVFSDKMKMKEKYVYKIVCSNKIIEDMK